jgi:hypothetical protein
MTDSGDLLEPPSVAGTQCLVFQPAVLAANWIYLALGVPCTLWLSIKILREKSAQRIKVPPGSASHESWFRGAAVKKIDRDRVRHWFQLVCVAMGSALSLYTEASRTGWFYRERFGFNDVVVVLFFISEVSFFVSCLLFLERVRAKTRAVWCAGCAAWTLVDSCSSDFDRAVH